MNGKILYINSLCLPVRPSVTFCCRTLPHSKFQVPTFARDVLLQNATPFQVPSSNLRPNRLSVSRGPQKGPQWAVAFFWGGIQQEEELLLDCWWCALAIGLGRIQTFLTRRRRRRKKRRKMKVCVFFLTKCVCVLCFADVRTVLMDDSLFTKAAEEAFPEYNVKHMIPVELLDHSGKVFFLLSFC